MRADDTIVIVGAGQAGSWVAVALRQQGHEGPVILLGDEAYPPYERPPLSKGILLGEDPARACLRPVDDYSALGIDLRSGTSVVALDLHDRKVNVHDGSAIGFDRLVLTTGAVARSLRVQGAGLANVVSLRTVDDALIIRARLAERPRTVIVGGGLIGLETAAAARAAQCEVTVLEARPALMQRVVPDGIGDFFADVHRQRGTTILLEETVDRFEGRDRVERVVCRRGRHLAADLVIVAVGADPAVGLAAQAGLAVDDGIVVDSRGRTSHPAVYAAGDVTFHPNRHLGRSVRLESWHNAQNQAIAVAKVLCGGDAPYDELPWFWTDQFDVNLQVAGLPLTWDRVVVRGDVRQACFAAFYLVGDRVAGLCAVNRPRDMAVGRRLIERRLSTDAALLADDQVPLKRMLKQ